MGNHCSNILSCCDIIYCVRYKKDTCLIEIYPYPLKVPHDFIQGIEEDEFIRIDLRGTTLVPIRQDGLFDGFTRFLYLRSNVRKDVQHRIPIQETSPDPRAVIYNIWPIQDAKVTFPILETNQDPCAISYHILPRDGGPPEISRLHRLWFHWKKLMKDVRTKFHIQEANLIPSATSWDICPKQAEPPIRHRRKTPWFHWDNKGFIKAFKYILCCYTHNTDEIDEDSEYVAINKYAPYNPAGADITFPDEFSADLQYVKKKNNLYNPAGAEADIGVPDDWLKLKLKYPIQETDTYLDLHPASPKSPYY
ncbi:uncharacterized protein [Dendropsophus ebraccatus]|uniref:uncharacterized protein n=1 Tax=Dendropsophus ebraccatus TaxID=150705 RepID=UPI003831EBC4